ncbi:GNAT family N-acetyltransferase [Actinotalea ferrariae]|uniref:GNAT family N-acetyltransferase n=1 Tax=Actinotalea ferrariae TaxID=1386098 RepID=UPI001C8B5144|nr:GNAT family N-acetyltransferase [Actinotalea ferrariae]MBX9243983.1 GNAT family N-acetyltransferase [Actinotalea ferrariae]
MHRRTGAGATTVADDVWTVHRVPVPESLDAADAWGVRAVADISTQVERDHWGYDDLAYTPQHCLTYLRNQQFSTRIELAVVRGTAVPTSPDDVAGTAAISMPREGTTGTAFLEVLVRPAERRHGAGSALVAAAEQLALEHGRRTAIVYTDHTGEPPAGAAALEPPTGSGRIAADDPAATFALRRGYVLEQAERYSVLELPVEPGLLERLESEARERAGADYRRHVWTDRTPDAWLDQVAHLYTRMSTDVPVAGLEIDEDPWSPERVRSFEADNAAARFGAVTIAAEHVPTGTLAGFTLVKLPLDQRDVVHQEDTLVLREHRGRRLGMVMKVAMLRHLADHRPTARRVHTWNAEENAFMLGINVALGFRRRGVNAGWQRRLA